MELKPALNGAVTLLALTTLATPVAAQELDSSAAAGAEVFYSSDSDDTEIVRAAIDLDISNRGEDRRYGIRVEKAWYDPSATGTRERERVFLRAADISGDWNWSALVGTDGDTIIGSASVHDNSPWRKEAFVERDIVATPRGLDEGIYSTFAGAALDIPADDSNVFTVLGGVQEFTGDNVRLHARANFVHVVDEQLGLSAQLRTRYFHSSDPNEFDYYSPRYYVQALPVIQMRRFVERWELVGVVGVGAQRDATSDWKRSDFLNLRVRSPKNDENWQLHADLTYTNQPGDSAISGSDYSYFQTRFGLMRRF
ncbi:hypothetical protein GRI69_10775 [Erythrobacter vulgaris]|uniref:DUF481 domain-containing protein n=1 Tax=Qipengyuania vulgaris TaxID=291985 RepID=A0A844XTK9_9SPHN|nr:hypothetical protein [Qipengyuania vulgaris]MXO48739.1 hypothetical protein [Qipengyuania vulgaris]